MTKKSKEETKSVQINEKEKKYMVIGVIVVITLLFIFALVTMIASKFETNQNTKQIIDPIKLEHKVVAPVEKTSPVVEDISLQSAEKAISLLTTTMPWLIGLLIGFSVFGGMFSRL